ncbi:MAG: NADH-quinone oxidoreductase subunit NuoH [Flammeovirgaceae bacterium]
MWIAFFIFLGFLLGYTVWAVYTERKIAAFIQDRLGPMEVGKYGMLQTVADLLKLLQKEDIIASRADKLLFKIAPLIIFTAIFSGFAVMPIAQGVIGSDLPTGVLYLMAIVSFDVIGIVAAGWGSNNKFALYGAVRSIAQIVSYEIPFGLSVLCVVVLSQTLSLQTISVEQGIFGTENMGFLSSMGGIFAWNIFKYPLLLLVFPLFYITALAEANRAPFDLPEAESELIAGYHTEYSGFRWALMMLSEFGAMLLMSFLGAVLFLGSWNTIFPNIGNFRLAEYTSGVKGEWSGYLWGAFWLFSKALFLVMTQMWVRWTYPRLRVDQLMSLCWKYLTPFGLLMFLLCAIWKLWIG